MRSEMRARTKTKEGSRNEGHVLVCQFHLFIILIEAHPSNRYLFKTQKSGGTG